MTKKQERHIVASIGTLLFLAIVFLLLWLIKLHAYQPEQEEGIEVAFGEVEEAGGYMAEQSEAVPLPAPEPTAPDVASAPSDNDLMTSEDEETLALRKAAEEAEKARKQAEAEKQRKAREEQARLEAERKAREAAEAAERAKQAEAIAKANQFGSLFGQSGNSSGSGDSQGAGQKGNPVGHGSIGVRDTRISGLGGRNTRDGKIPEPTCEFQHYGVVVVKIRIDKEGNVISAVNAAGTNTSDQQMIQCAINAIKTTKWTVGEGVSEGTITYTFNVY